MLARDGYMRVKQALGEGLPFTFDDASILRDLNFAARSLCSAGQSLQDTYELITKQNPNEPSGTFYDQYIMPQNCEMIYPDAATIQIGATLYPLNLQFTERQLRAGGYCGATPINGYIRRGIILAQRTSSGGLRVYAPPGTTGKYANFAIGLWPVPQMEYKIFIDYVALHPEITEPLDPILINGLAEFFDVWTAYAIANGKELEGDMVSAEFYRNMFKDGLQAYKNYCLAGTIQVTPPTWGESAVYNRDASDVGTMQPTVSQLKIQ